MKRCRNFLHPQSTGNTGLNSNILQTSALRQAALFWLIFGHFIARIKSREKERQTKEKATFSHQPECGRKVACNYCINTLRDAVMKNHRFSVAIVRNCKGRKKQPKIAPPDDTRVHRFFKLQNLVACENFAKTTCCPQNGQTVGLDMWFEELSFQQINTLWKEEPYCGATTTKHRLGDPSNWRSLNISFCLS